MDLVVWHSSYPETARIDFTARNPQAARYLPHAADTAGHAIHEAEREKTRRYGKNSGVICAAMEVFGRLGSGTRDVLHLLDSIHAFVHPGTRSKFGLMAAELQTAVARATVRNIVTALDAGAALALCSYTLPRPSTSGEPTQY